jgi:hypothetical protein
MAYGNEDKYKKRKDKVMQKVEPKKMRPTKEKSPQERLHSTPRQGAKMTYLGDDGKKYTTKKQQMLANRKYREHVGSKKRQGEYIKPGTEGARIQKGEALKKARRAHPGKQLRWDKSKNAYVPIG